MRTSPGEPDDTARNPLVQDNEVPFAIETDALVRRFGTQAALNGVSLQVRVGEFFSLLGPSGCGKTTLLRLIAGLDIPDEGTIRLHGDDVSHLPAHRRPVNTVFQSYALFPHLTVRENVAFGLRMKKVPGAEITSRVERMLSLMQITGLAERRPQQLSGGEKQRVALARAAVNEPKVLLLDEPLGALDLKLRQELQHELHQLQRRLGITFVHVTHDQTEALTMSDRIAVMNAGRIEQLGNPRELYEHPRTRFVAQFLGSCNLVSATLKTVSGSICEAETPLGTFIFSPTSNAPLQPSAQGTLAVRPERVLFGEGSENNVQARLLKTIYGGAETQYFLEAKGQSLKVVTLNLTSHPIALTIGQDVSLHFPRENLRWLET